MRLQCRDVCPHVTVKYGPTLFPNVSGRCPEIELGNSKTFPYWVLSFGTISDSTSSAVWMQQTVLGRIYWSIPWVEGIHLGTLVPDLSTRKSETLSQWSRAIIRTHVLEWHVPISSAPYSSRCRDLTLSLTELSWWRIHYRVQRNIPVEPKY